MTRGVVEPRRRHVQGVLQVAEARVRRVVPEQAPAPARYQEGHDVHDVELVHVHVVAGVVHEAVLVRAQAIEGLTGGGLELGLHVEGGLAHDLGRDEGLAAARLLRQQDASARVQERHRAAGQGDAGGQALGHDGHRVVGGLDVERRRRAGVRDGDDRPAAEERARWRVDDAHDVLAADMQLQPSLAHGQGDAVREPLRGAGGTRRGDDGEQENAPGASVHSILPSEAQILTSAARHRARRSLLQWHDEAGARLRAVPIDEHVARDAEDPRCLS